MEWKSGMENYRPIYCGRGKFKQDSSLDKRGKFLIEKREKYERKERGKRERKESKEKKENG